MSAPILDKWERENVTRVGIFGSAAHSYYVAVRVADQYWVTVRGYIARYETAEREAEKQQARFGLKKTQRSLNASFATPSGVRF